MAHELRHEGFGAAGAAGMDSNYGQGMGVLNTLGGSAKAGQQAMDYANQLYPQVAEADPWEAAFKFFAEMGKQASKPGATVLGSAVSSMSVPFDYLQAKKAERNQTDRARMTAAVQLAPGLKAPVVKATYSDPKFYMVSKPDGKGGFTPPVQTPLTAKEFSELDKTFRVTAVPKAGTSGAQSPLGKLIADYNNGAGSMTKVQFDAQFEKLTNIAESGDSGAQSPLGKLIADYDNGAGSMTKAQFDAQFEKLTASPNPPQGSAPERATNRVLDFVDAFTVNPAVEPRSLAQFLSDVRVMAKPQIISFKDTAGNMQSASTPGVDAYKFISESYGPEVANAIKALSKGQPTVVVTGTTGDTTGDDTTDTTGDDTGDSGVKKVVVAGKEFTVFSSTPASMPKEASDAIVDAAGALKDIDIAYGLLFPNGELNKLAIVAANFLPDGGLNLTKVDTDSRTAYQSMRRVIELILRARTGAAAPEAEVQNYLKLYFPASLDNDQQARNKFITLAQYFTDTTRILSQGRLLYDPSIPEADRKFDVTKHGIPLGDAASSAANDAPDVVTVTSEWTLDGVKYKQLSDGRIITEEAK